MIKDEPRASALYRYGGNLSALLWSFKDFLKGKGRLAATGQGRGRGRIVLALLDSAGPAASIIHSMERARAKGKTEPVEALREELNRARPMSWWSSATTWTCTWRA
jgi:hypothetical protein